MHVAVNNFLLAVPIAILYYGLMLERTWFSRFLSTPLMQLLGKSSYAFYVLHILVIEYLARPYISRYFTNSIFYGVVCYLLTAVLSIAIYLFYEHPMNKAIRKKYGQHTNRNMVMQYAASSSDKQENHANL